MRKEEIELEINLIFSNHSNRIIRDILKMTELTQVKKEILDLKIGPIHSMEDKAAIYKIIEIIQGNNIFSYATINFIVVIDVRNKGISTDTRNNIVQVA